MPTIDVDAITHIAQIGINRALLFMGFGVNLAVDKEFKNYQLYKHTAYLGILPSAKNDEELQGWKNEFGKWVITNGLREVTESLDLYLDSVNRFCLFIEIAKGKTDKSDAKKRDRKFMSMGKEDKYSELNESYGLGIKNVDMLLSINQARNCLSHRHGIVGLRDVKPSGNTFEVKWLAIQAFVLNADGSETPVELPMEKMVEIIEGSHPAINYRETRRIFLLGDVLHFEPKELVDICMFIQRMIIEIKNSAADYAKRLGCEVIEKNRPK